MNELIGCVGARSDAGSGTTSQTRASVGGWASVPRQPPPPPPPISRLATMLTKACSLPQITLTDCDARQNDQVLFGDNDKASRTQKTTKLNVFLPNTVSIENLSWNPPSSVDMFGKHETEKQGIAEKKNESSFQKLMFKVPSSIKSKKVSRQQSLTMGQIVKPKVPSSRRSSLDIATKTSLIDDRRKSLESPKSSVLTRFGNKLSQKTKPTKEKTQKKSKPVLTMKKTSSPPQDESIAGSAKKKEVTPLMKEDDKNNSTQRGNETETNVLKESSPKKAEPGSKKISFCFPTSSSVDNLKSKISENELSVVENTQSQDKTSNGKQSSDKEKDKGSMVDEKQGKAIAKHLMNSTREKLQKFKLAAKKKGVKGPDAYDEMCDRTKTLGGTGRRIFEKEEIFSEEDLKNDDKLRIQNAKSKFMDFVDNDLTHPSTNDLKDPMKSFGLWDDCDPKLVAKAKGENKEELDIIAELPDYERTKERKDEMTKYMKEYNSLVIKESSASKSKLATGKYLPQSDFEFCLKHTKFEEVEVLRWFKGFRKECPTGHLAKSHLSKLFLKIFPGGNGGVFTNNIFRIFDKDNNGFMDFKEFLMALDVTTCKTKEDKLNWAFQLYDIDGDGTIDLSEMTTIIEILDDLSGMEVGELYLVGGEPEELPPAGDRAKQLLDLIDINGDGGISKDEFLAVGKKLFDYGEEEEEEDNH